MQKTPIGWTDFSSNPIRFRDKGGKVVNACVKISPRNMKDLTPFIDENEIHRLLTGKAISGKQVFIMSDLFGEWVTNDMLDQVFAVFALRPDVTFQVLTKRPSRMASYFNFIERGMDTSSRIWFTANGLDRGSEILQTPDWPFINVRLGVSAGNQELEEMRLKRSYRKEKGAAK